MQHKESDVKIYETTDYKLFSRIIGNRNLNSNKIKRIISDIESGLNMLPECPIVVSESKNGNTLDIIDGQHRFNVCRLIKSIVYYTIRKPLSLPEIAKVNSNQEKWKIKDIINCFVENGNKNYEDLKLFLEKYKLPNSVSMYLLTQGYNIREGGLNENVQKNFENGLFVVKTLNEAYAMAEIIEQFSFFKEAKNRLFIISIAKILTNEKIQIKDLILACEKK